MTSYKLCLTVLVLAGVSATASALYDPSSNLRRARRAPNSEEDRSSEAAADAEGLRAGYRFSDDYFLPEASRAVPKEQKTRENGCERVTKDSMVCMVCKDPKTNEKYEQCSYVAQPKDKAFSYSKSRSHGTPEKKQEARTRENDESDASGEAFESSHTPRADYEKFAASSKPTEASYNYEEGARSPSRYAGSSSGEDDKPGHFDYPESQEDKEEYNSYTGNESSEDPAESSDCRQVQKDGQTCTICKDPKTGSDLERCSSSFKPDDKSYSYGKSEKYGYPHSEDEGERYKSNSGEDGSAEAAPASYESSPSEFHAGYLKSKDDNYRKYHSGEPEELRESNYKENRERPSYEESSTSGEYSAPSVAAETKQPKETGSGGTDCREVRKDGEICTVCTDPKTGGNFQKCSYAYQPNDKVYKFTKSKTFGYPEAHKGNGKAAAKSAEDSAEHAREAETKQVPEAVKAEGPCRKVQRDSKTCTVCEDPITGESSEQCAYSYKPKEKHFRFTNSKSSGSPQKKTKKRGEKSGEEGQEESRQVPRWSGEGNKKSVKSKENSEAAESTSPCKQVQKDSMTCTVCKDPKTGASSEQCAYSSEPREKLFTYSKSKSSGGPQKPGKKRGGKPETSGPQESQRRQFIVEPEEDGAEQQIAESADDNSCKQVVKDSMTCTVCKDPKTGANSEQCAYSSEPKKKHFTYSKSKSFGSPRRRGDEAQESRPAPQWADDQHDYDSVHRTHGFSKPEWGYDV